MSIKSYFFITAWIFIPIVHGFSYGFFAGFLMGIASSIIILSHIGLQSLKARLESLEVKLKSLKTQRSKK